MTIPVVVDVPDRRPLVPRVPTPISVHGSYSQAGLAANAGTVTDVSTTGAVHAIPLVTVRRLMPRARCAISMILRALGVSCSLRFPGVVHVLCVS